MQHTAEPTPTTRAQTLDGTVVAVTGASGGIGAATARAVARRGGVVVVAARRERELQSLAAEIHEAGGTASYVVCDVGSREDLVRLVATAVEVHGHLDVLVNNAGIAPISPMADLRVADWEDMIDINLRGPLFGIAAALPHFASRGQGHIVNVVSTAGIQISPTMAVYAGTKNALRTVTEGLRTENVPGLRVTAISPGFVDTGLSSSMTDPDLRAQVARAGAEMGISAAAVAEAIVYAITQPPEVEVGELVLRPTAQA